ncbi:hypothetical protein L21SP4_01321 [Kiritimatiella glycovorans]|uniref:Uncharacterized protein n=1 Tax=Kiritimatiella glycovorans TaxID=1307763 RepID=A0A0G3EK78_9BACT|nr:hypothetical protein L21SP4_01321 [Kiritimatiella glycovorans]
MRAADRYRDRRAVEYGITLTPGGGARIDWTRRYFGSAYTSFHREFAEMIPEERRRHFERLVSSIAQSAAREGEPRAEYTTYPGVQTITVTADPYAVRDGDLLYFTLPDGMTDLLRCDADERTLPLYRDTFHRELMRFRIRVPEGFSPVRDEGRRAIMLPDGVSTITRASAYDPDSRIWTIEYEADLRPAVTEARDYDRLLEIGRELALPAERTVIMRKNGS